MKSKTFSVRVPTDMQEKIDTVCDGIGCTRNDWIKDAIKDKLREENSQDQETIEGPTAAKEVTAAKEAVNKKEDTNSSKIVYVDIPELKPIVTLVPEITVENVEQEPQKPPVNYVNFNDKCLPFAKRYEI